MCDCHAYTHIHTYAQIEIMTTIMSEEEEEEEERKSVCVTSVGFGSVSLCMVTCSLFEHVHRRGEVGE